jgi:hypothetical protein
MVNEIMERGELLARVIAATFECPIFEALISLVLEMV